MQFDIYSVIFVALIVPLAIAFWRMIASLLINSPIDSLQKAGQGLGGIV